MIRESLITFNRNNNLVTSADLGEKAGNIGLGLLRIGFGNTVAVEKISADADKITFTKKLHSTSAKVAAIALFILALPVTILLAGIGLLGMAYSKSHGRIFKAYNQSVLLNNPEDRAAITIQKHFRGYLARKSHLLSNLYPHYRVQCEKVKALLRNRADV